MLAATLRMMVASARTIAEEMAATWWASVCRDAPYSQGTILTGERTTKKPAETGKQRAGPGAESGATRRYQVKRGSNRFTVVDTNARIRWAATR